jgi:CRP-like cAMP-binding protein
MSDNGAVTVDVNRLKNSMFFRQMPDSHLDQLAAIGREVNLPAHKTIFEEYDRAKDVYIILSGEVSLVICEPKDSCRQIAVVGEGDLVGWSPLVGRSRLTDTAVTLTPVKAFVFEGKKLLEFCEANPSFGFEFMRRAATELAKRLSGTRLQLLQMCGNRFPIFAMQPETD